MGIRSEEMLKVYLSIWLQNHSIKVGETQNVTRRCVAAGRERPTVATTEDITPAKRALAALDTPAPAEPISAIRITKKVRAAIDLLVSGESTKIRTPRRKSAWPAKASAGP
jgi:hypothetical protein